MSVRSCGFKSHRSHQKRRDTRSCASSFLVRHFCCAKVVACGRVIEREWGNPSKVPPSHSPFLAIGRGEGTKPVGNHKIGRYLLVSFSFAVLPPGSRSLYLLPAESAAGLFSLRRQLQQGLFIVRRSVQHSVQQILQRITDLAPPQSQCHQVAALHRQVLQ